MDRKKLHCLVGPTPLRVLAPTGRPRDADAEVGGQRPVDAEAEGQRPEGERGPEFESGGPRPAGSGLELEDKWMRKSHSIFDSF